MSKFSYLMSSENLQWVISEVQDRNKSSVTHSFQSLKSYFSLKIYHINAVNNFSKEILDILYLFLKRQIKSWLKQWLGHELPKTVSHLMIIVV